MFYNLLIESQLCGPVCWVLALTCVFPLRIWPFIYSLALTLFFGYNSSNLFPWNPLAWFCVFGFILKERKISKGGWVRWKSFSWDPGSDKVFILSSLKVFFFFLVVSFKKDLAEFHNGFSSLFVKVICLVVCFPRSSLWETHRVPRGKDWKIMWILRLWP